MKHVLTGIGTPLLVTLALMMAPVASWAQEPSLAELLARATDYVNELSDQLSGIVAEERYEQRSTTPVVSGFGRDRRDRGLTAQIKGRLSRSSNVLGDALLEELRHGWYTAQTLGNLGHFARGLAKSAPAVWFQAK